MVVRNVDQLVVRALADALSRAVRLHAHVPQPRVARDALLHDSVIFEFVLTLLRTV